MSKPLIDLSRATKPEATPTTPEPKRKREAPEPVAASETPSANLNRTSSAPVTVVASVPVQPSFSAERVSTIGARIPESLHQTIRVFCIANRMELQAFVQEALTNHLARLQSPGAE